MQIKNKERWGRSRIFLMTGCVLLFFFFGIEVSSAYSMYLNINSSLEVTRMYVFESNPYYDDLFYSGTSGNRGIPVNLFKEGEMISSKKISDSGNVIFAIDDPRVEYGFSVGFIFSSPEKRSVELCNNNGVCEPCLSGYCAIAESHAVCGDCSSGSEDNYCDLEQDGICDPDCRGLETDCGCEQDSCYTKEKVQELKECKGLGGNPCTVYEYCDGENVYSDDYGTRCCVGRCVDMDEKDDEALLEEAEESRKASKDEKSQEKLYEESYFYEEQDEVNNNNIILIFLFVLSLVSLVVGYTYFFHKESAEHFDDPLVRYIDGLLSQGYTKQQILPFMLQHGYKEKRVRNIFRKLKK